MDEKDFDPIDFVKQISKFSGMTFAQSVSKSLKNIMGKLLESDADKHAANTNLVGIPLEEALAIIRGEE